MAEGTRPPRLIARPWARAADALSIPAEPKESTSEEAKMLDEQDEHDELTEDQKEYQKEQERRQKQQDEEKRKDEERQALKEEEPEFDTEPKFDLEKVSQLLEILDLAGDEANLKPLFDDAYRCLVAIGQEMVHKAMKEQKDAEGHTK